VTDDTDDDLMLLLAAGWVMRSRIAVERGLADDAEVALSLDELRAFVAGCDRRQLRQLRRIARSIGPGEPVPIH
jgi:hypothetical protein